MDKNTHIEYSRDNRSKTRKYKNQKSQEEFAKKRMRPQFIKQQNEKLLYKEESVNNEDIDNKKNYISQTTNSQTPLNIKGQNAVSSKSKSKHKKEIESYSYNKIEENRTDSNCIEIDINNTLSVSELSEKTQISETEIIKYLFLEGYIVTINQTLDIETIKLIGQKFCIEIKVEDSLNIPHRIKVPNPNKQERCSSENFVQSRAPIVTIMGHVDHGKTTLLDALRSVESVKNEAGGITQKIIAHEIYFKNRKIIFLDTPGHEAFKTIRSRGSKINDIAILIVAADEGLKPQTLEAIQYFKQSKVPIIVAINKIDKQEANIERTKQALTEYNIIPEELGGEEIIIPISALQKSNLDILLETILLITDLNDFKANHRGKVEASILEAHLDKTRGPIATVLLQNGLLCIGDILVVKTVSGKIRSIINTQSQKLSCAKPSCILEVTGFSALPEVGEILEIVPSEKIAKTKIKKYKQDSKKIFQLESLKYSKPLQNVNNCNYIIKADLQSSLEAIINMLNQIPQNKIKINVIKAQTGEIGETDVELAIATNSHIINFNTSLSIKAKKLAAQKSINIIEHKIIYKLIEAIQELLKTKIQPEYETEKIGEGIVKAVFSVSKGIVAGCYIKEGKILNNSHVEIIRNNQIIYEGKITSLKREKDNVEQVSQKNECGIFIENFESWKFDDFINIFKIKAKPMSLK